MELFWTFVFLFALFIAYVIKARADGRKLMRERERKDRRLHQELEREEAEHRSRAKYRRLDYEVEMEDRRRQQIQEARRLAGDQA